MNYGKIKINDIANGTGIRVSLFVSGCRNNCPGCFNKEAQDFTYGEHFSDEQLNFLIEELKPEHIEGLTILGGEPLDSLNQPTVFYIVDKIKNILPNKNIWLYTGYDFPMIPMTDFTYEILNNIDVLVDGPFIEDKKDPSLAFRGSSNQRIIDMKETLKQEIVVLKEID
jgi:anaerobic ribonucleoside-triphosphate reductase activating protein